MAACVLALLVIVPTTSLAACLCVEDAAVTQASVDSAQGVESEQHEDDAPCKAACCVGGHCHHAGSLLNAPFLTITAPAPVVAKHAVAPTRALASRAPSALDRPPRA